MKKLWLFLLLPVFLAAPILAASAAGARTGNSVYIPAEEVVDGNLMAAGNSITVDGNVAGDLIAAGQTITVNGRVEGDLIAAGQTITVNGDVGGNIRIAGSAISLNGSVGRNVNAFGNTVFIGRDSEIGWDLLVMSAKAEIRGEINGSVEGGAAQVMIDAKIGRDVNLKLSKETRPDGLIVASGTEIAGNLNYTAKSQAQISEQAKVSGQTNRHDWPTKQSGAVWSWILDRIIAMFSAIVVGLAMIFLMRKPIDGLLEKLPTQPGWKILSGLLIFAVLPIASLILIMTVIGLPLGLIIAAKWLVAIYVARVLTALWLGAWLLKQLKMGAGKSLLPALAVGVFVSWLLFAIPAVGWIISLLAVCFGLGAFWAYVKNQFVNI